MTELPATTSGATPAFLTDALREGGAIGADTAVAEVAARADRGRRGHRRSARPPPAPLRGPGQGRAGDGDAEDAVASSRRTGRSATTSTSTSGRAASTSRSATSWTCARRACYWNHIDPETRTFGLLLEDLGDRTMISQVEGMGPERAAEALRCARCAARRLVGVARARRARLDAPTHRSDQPRRRAAVPRRLALLRRADRRRRSRASAIELGERVQVDFEDVMQAMMGDAPSTICHGDFRVDNLLFDDVAAER